jgi:hypothetical protein
MESLETKAIPKLSSLPKLIEEEKGCWINNLLLLQ